jgi:hypothetical protein
MAMATEIANKKHMGGRASGQHVTVGESFFVVDSAEGWYEGL